MACYTTDLGWRAWILKPFSTGTTGSYTCTTTSQIHTSKDFGVRIFVRTTQVLFYVDCATDRVKQTAIDVLRFLMRGRLHNFNFSVPEYSNRLWSVISTVGRNLAGCMCITRISPYGRNDNYADCWIFKQALRIVENAVWHFALSFKRYPDRILSVQFWEQALMIINSDWLI